MEHNNEPTEIKEEEDLRKDESTPMMTFGPTEGTEVTEERNEAPTTYKEQPEGYIYD